MTPLPDTSPAPARRWPRRLWIGPDGQRHPFHVQARRAELLQLTGDWAAAEQARARNLEAALAAADDRAMAEARIALAPLLMHTGRYDGALDLAGRARQGFEALGDRLSALRTLVVSGEAENIRGNYESALADYSEELRLAQDLGDEAETAQALNNLGNVHRKILVKDVRDILIRTVDFNILEDTKNHDRMVSLVNQMLILNKQLHIAKTPHEKDTLQRQIEATDQQIDRLVYELYGLTEEEIKVVEGEKR